MTRTGGHGVQHSVNDPLSGAWGGGRTDGAAARGEVGSCGPPQASELSAAARRRVPPLPLDENLGFLAGGRREPTNPTRKRIERLRRIRRPESGFGAGLGHVRPTGADRASRSAVSKGRHRAVWLLRPGCQISILGARHLHGRNSTSGYLLNTRAPWHLPPTRGVRWVRCCRTHDRRHPSRLSSRPAAGLPNSTAWRSRDAMYQADWPRCASSDVGR